MRVYAYMLALVLLVAGYFLLLDLGSPPQTVGPPAPATVILRQDARINILRRGDFVLATYSDVTGDASLCYAAYSTHRIECGRAIQPPTIGELSWPDMD
jgi:hypothetical protein